MHSAPLAQVSLSAIAHNARIALATGARVADLRADAWGHGAAAVAAVLRAAGAERFRVDERTAELLGPSGRDGLTRSIDPDIDPSTVYGMPGSAPGTRPAMRLTGTVLTAKRLLAGEGVSYGYRHRAPADTRVALVSGGYAQGIARGVGGRVSVGRGTRRFQIVGRVAMDVCVVEIGDAALSRGDEVVFFGDPARDEPTVAAWSAATGLGAAELVTIVGLRAQREQVA